jgi:hypothetical protein
MNKIHNWVNTALIGIVLLLVLVGGNQSDSSSLGGTTHATWTAANLVSNGNLTVFGTSTIAHSPDGFVMWDDFTVGTTTSVVRGVITNNGSAVICDPNGLAVYASSTGASLLAPSFMFVVGTTTSATAYSSNLMASTTVATSTSSLLGTTTKPFLLDNGISITLSVGDAVTNASSTYYGNWTTAEFSIPCRTVGQ